MNLKDDLLRGIYAYGFEKPSAIQQRAIVPLAKVCLENHVKKKKKMFPFVCVCVCAVVCLWNYICFVYFRMHISLIQQFRLFELFCFVIHCFINCHIFFWQIFFVGFFFRKREMIWLLKRNQVPVKPQHLPLVFCNNWTWTNSSAKHWCWRLLVSWLNKSKRFVFWRKKKWKKKILVKKLWLKNASHMFYRFGFFLLTIMNMMVTFVSVCVCVCVGGDQYWWLLGREMPRVYRWYACARRHCQAAVGCAHCGRYARSCLRYVVPPSLARQQHQVVCVGRGRRDALARFQRPNLRHLSSHPSLCPSNANHVFCFCFKFLFI